MKTAQVLCSVLLGAQLAGAEIKPVKPLSDQAIANLLADEDIKIARRTVAKYREELGILPTNLRRQYD